ncbi:MAG: serine--tRNA ligase, partial [Bacteroidota bacterium]
MLDLKFIRENTELVREGIRKKGEKDSLKDILQLDEQRREILQQVEAMKNRRNVVSEDVAKLKKNKLDASEVIAEMAKLKEQIQKYDDELKIVETELNKLLLAVPNIPHSSVPVGKTDEDNIPIFTWGKIEESDFPLKPHWEIAAKYGLIDFERGTIVAGAGFPFYIGKGAKLQRALINFFLDEAEKKGY